MRGRGVTELIRRRSDPSDWLIGVAAVALGVVVGYAAVSWLIETLG